MKFINDDCFNHISRLSCGVVFTSSSYNRKRNDKYSNYEDTLNDYFEFLVNFINNVQYNKYLFLNVRTNFYNKQDVYELIGKYYNKIQQMFMGLGTTGIACKKFSRDFNGGNR